MQDRMMTDQPNPERIGVNVGLLLLALGLLLMVGPSLAGMDMMGGGYALGFIGLFVGLSGLVTWWFFHRRSAVLDRILSGQGVLAHWTYDLAKAQQDAREEFEERSELNRQQFLLVAGMMVVAGFFFLILPMMRSGDWSVFILLVYFGAMLLIGWVAYAAPRTAYRRALRWGAEAFVSSDGVWVRGALHTWKEPFTKLKQVKLVERRGQTALEFRFRYLTRLGWIHYETRTVQVPVPADKVDEAEKVVHLLGGK